MNQIEGYPSTSNVRKIVYVIGDASRLASPVSCSPGLPHHLTQRGNNRQDVFFTDDDRRACPDPLTHHAQRLGLRVLAWCLMTNHIHLLVVPPTEASLATAIGRPHFRYSQYINRLHRRSDHLW